MSVILLWHLANWNGFSPVDVFLNNQSPPAFALQTQRHGQNNGCALWGTPQKFKLEYVASALCPICCCISWFFKVSLECLVSQPKVWTSVVNGKQQIHYDTVALSLALRCRLYCLSAICDFERQHLKTKIGQQDKAQVALVTSEWQKPFPLHVLHESWHFIYI